MSSRPALAPRGVLLEAAYYTEYQALGMLSASLYHNITSKEELLHAMSLESLDHIELAVERDLADEPESKKASRLRSLIIAHTSAAVSKRESMQSCSWNCGV